MSSGMRFDAATSRRLVHGYRTQDIVAQRQITREAIAARPGERVLDIGSGPGMLAAELALEVGPEGRIDGVDVSEVMLSISREQPPTPGAGRMRFHEANAAALPFPEESFDIVVCTQVYEYVAEIETALAEAHRVLVPGGRFVVIDTDWDSLVWRVPDAGLMARVMTVWDEHLADPHLPRRLPQLLRETGFSEVATSSFPLLNVGFSAETFSAGLLNLVEAFVGGRGGITEAEAHAWADSVRALGENYFFSLNRYLFRARR